MFHTASIRLLKLAVVACCFLFTSTSYADIFGTGGNAFTMEFVPIGNPGNLADTTGSPSPAGSVDYSYRMGKYEVSEGMIDAYNVLFGLENGLVITKDTRGSDKPATSVSWNEAARFVNWLNTSSGGTEAYKFTTNGVNDNISLWTSSDAGFNASNPFRNSQAKYFLPSFDEWHKAAYYDPMSGTYFDYPTGSDSVPDGIDFAGDTTFDAVFFDGGINPDPNDITDVGVLSPYGTAGQGGNVFEWEESEFDLVNDSSSSFLGLRGGNWVGFSDRLLSSNRSGSNPSSEGGTSGFRVASVPEPSSPLPGALVSVGLLVRRRR